jgi:hypothetical protein
MEKCVLVPNRLQDIGPREQKVRISNQDDVEEIEGLHTLFLVLKNIKSELTTGKLKTNTQWWREGVSDMEVMARFGELINYLFMPLLIYPFLRFIYPSILLFI